MKELNRIELLNVLGGDGTTPPQPPEIDGKKDNPFEPTAD
jgi:hypothetical protein